MRILITAGPTREPIDQVRYISNRSSGRLGLELARIAQAAGHAVTLVLGPVAGAPPTLCRVMHVETTREMYEAVMAEFPANDLLIMAAAPADYRPTAAVPGKIARGKTMALELESTPDILAAAGLQKRPDQRTIGFSLETSGNIDRAREKLQRKHLDLIVYNTIETISSPHIEATLLWPDGTSQELASRPKEEFADILLQRAAQLMLR